VSEVLYLPRVLRPVPSVIQSGSPNAQQIGDAPFAIVHGPPGSFVAELLAGLIEEWGRWPACVWLRPTGFRWGSLAELLVQACRFRWADEALQKGQIHVAPNAELADMLRLAPAGAVIVLEFPGQLIGDTAHLLDMPVPTTTRSARSTVWPRSAIAIRGVYH
jgi:hypothetical protein